MLTFESITLALVVGYLVWKLYDVTIRKPPAKEGRIRLVSKETGQVLEMKLLPVAPAKDAAREWNEGDFLNTAKALYQLITNTFASGQVKELKPLLSEAVYGVFQRDVQKRNALKNKVEFTLIGFNSVKITDKSLPAEKVRVEFVTEQINLLKDGNDSIIEGDPMNIATVRDIWTFKKSGKSGWILCATTRGQVHAPSV